MSEAAPREPDDDPIDPSDAFREDVVGRRGDPNPPEMEALTPLQALNAAIRAQGGNATITRVRQVGSQGAHFYIDVQSNRHEEPFTLRSFTEAQLDSLDNVSRAVQAAGGGRFPRPRKKSEDWWTLTEAIIAAVEFEEHGSTEAGSWTRRIARFIGEDNYGKQDPDHPDGRKGMVEGYVQAVVAPDGRLWLHAGSFLEFLSVRRVQADDATVRSALKALGFESQKITARVEGTVRGRNYWRSPEGFDWRSEA